MDEVTREEIDLEDIFGVDFPISGAEVERYPNGTIKRIVIALWDGSEYEAWGH